MDILVMFSIFMLLVYFVGVLLHIEADTGASNFAIIIWPIILAARLLVGCLVFINLLAGVLLFTIGIRYADSKLYQKIDDLM